jgi:hypothetical protein
MLRRYIRHHISPSQFPFPRMNPSRLNFLLTSKFGTQRSAASALVRGTIPKWNITLTRTAIGWGQPRHNKGKLKCRTRIRITDIPGPRKLKDQADNFQNLPILSEYQLLFYISCGLQMVCIKIDELRVKTLRIQ